MHMQRKKISNYNLRNKVWLKKPGFQRGEAPLAGVRGQRPRSNTSKQQIKT